MWELALTGPGGVCLGWAPRKGQCWGPSMATSLASPHWVPWQQCGWGGKLPLCLCVSVCVCVRGRVGGFEALALAVVTWAWNMTNVQEGLV